MTSSSASPSLGADYSGSARDRADAHPGDQRLAGRDGLRLGGLGRVVHARDQAEAPRGCELLGILALSVMGADES